jgi:hypothetical protein
MIAEMSPAERLDRRSLKLSATVLLQQKNRRSGGVWVVYRPRAADAEFSPEISSDAIRMIGRACVYCTARRVETRLH